MRYWPGIMIMIIALVLGGFGILFGQFGLDVVAVLVALLAVGVFLWSSLHLSLWLRSPRQRKYDIPDPRSDEEQAAMLGDVIFLPRDDAE
ncbi:MAG: hypothetical protein H0U76_10660 [Ktedonobacteraceae bacterium]|nr:hypothetical protein [Ktedonobacteraceae bacterium]